MIHLKRTAKFLSVILAFILTFSTAFPVISQAVTYPEGITAEQTKEVIPKLNNLLKNILRSNPETKDLKNTVYSMLYKDETVNSLFAEIYTALAENGDALSVIGVDISPASLSAKLSNYPDISSAIADCSDINGVIKASANFKWGITSETAFGKALSAILSPFDPLLNALLCSGTVEINALISIQGDDGYSAAIVPLLKALDCPSIMTSADFASSAAKNSRNIIRNIISMVFDALDIILDDPVIGLCKTLPKLAFYLNSGKLSESITKLLEPLSLKIAGIFTIPGISDLISEAANLEESMNLNEMLEGIDLSSLLGPDVKLQIPEMNLQELADCVTANGDELTTDEPAAFITIMNFLAETIKLNRDSLGALMGGAEDMSAMLDPLLSKTNEELTATIISLFSITSAPVNNAVWTFPSVTGTQVSYTPTLTSMDYAEYLLKVDPLLTDFVKETDPEGTIEKTLRKTIYSNSLVSELVKGIFGMLGSEDMAPMLSLLGMDVTPTGIGNAVFQYYPYTARQLYKYSSWEKVNTASLSWGFYDGDADGFVRAVTRVLTPFLPLLSCVLAGQNVTLLDSITIPGSDGYNTAVIPLLEALGCKAETIKTYSEFSQNAGSAKMISDILSPVRALIDEICASPVKTLCRILPNIIYFFNSGLMDNVLENLLYPVKYMLDTAGLGSLLDSAFADMGNMDMGAMMKDMMASADLGIALPEIDLKVFGTLGTPATCISKRTVNGAPAQYTYLTADEPGVFLSILRIFVGALSMEENSGLLTGLMGSEGSAPSEDGMPDMFAMYAGNITEKFKDMTTDEIIEWLCDLLFSESPVVEIPEEEEEIPTIIYEKKFELTTTHKLIIAVAVIALIALLYYILSVSGKLDNIKLKRRKKQEAKRRKKESKKLIKGGGVAVDSLEDMKTERSYRKKDERSEKAKANELLLPLSDNEKPVKIKLPKDKPLTEKQVARQEKREKADSEKATRIARNKLPDEKEAEKLARRQQAAAKRARKNELKIQKQYAKAKRQSMKKKK